MAGRGGSDVSLLLQQCRALRDIERGGEEGSDVSSLSLQCRFMRDMGRGGREDRRLIEQ